MLREERMMVIVGEQSYHTSIAYLNMRKDAYKPRPRFLYSRYPNALFSSRYMRAVTV
jgi:hypothetical protein